MKSFLLLISFVTIFGFNTQATHIVGGELEVQHVQDSTYKLRAILYFDVFYGSTDARDTLIVLHIFDKGVDTVMATYFAKLQTVETVNYSNPDCAVASLATERMIYEREVILNPEEYNQPSGYYLVWERCCRNAVINNIEKPDSTGMTFYLEFPPVEKDGQPFINSSPSLFPPLSDFACVDLPYFVDFRGDDVDGDSLVYSLSHPLKGNADNIVTAPFAAVPAPYPLVDFKTNYSVNNMIPGSPALS
ncbi:MAG: gliding motility-associated C-terminal domain-containing protein, partial [Flammeovirgaceae bacterium]